MRSGIRLVKNRHYKNEHFKRKGRSDNSFFNQDEMSESNDENNNGSINENQNILCLKDL